MNIYSKAKNNQMMKLSDFRFFKEFYYKEANMITVHSSKIMMKLPEITFYKNGSTKILSFVFCTKSISNFQ